MSLIAGCFSYVPVATGAAPAGTEVVVRHAEQLVGESFAALESIVFMPFSAGTMIGLMPDASTSSCWRQQRSSAMNQNAASSMLWRLWSNSSMPRRGAIFSERAEYLSVRVWGTTLGVLMVFALLGLFTLNGTTGFAVISSVFLFLVYLAYATPPSWMLYYLETAPAFAYVTAAGIAWAASLIGRPRGTPHDASFSWRSPRWTRALVAGAALLILPGLFTIKAFRGQHIVDRRHLERFASKRETIPEPHAILFVRYAPTHSGHVTYVRNVADLAQAHVWVVYDRGDAENARLIALAPTRATYLYDELGDSIHPYTPR